MLWTMYHLSYQVRTLFIIEGLPWTLQLPPNLQLHPDLQHQSILHPTLTQEQWFHYFCLYTACSSVLTTIYWAPVPGMGLFLWATTDTPLTLWSAHQWAVTTTATNSNDNNNTVKTKMELKIRTSRKMTGNNVEEVTSEKWHGTMSL